MKALKKIIYKGLRSISITMTLIFLALGVSAYTQSPAEETGTLPVNPDYGGFQPGGIAQERYALFEDQLPWNSNRNETILMARGIAFDVYPSTRMGDRTLDLSRYKKVIIVAQQQDFFHQRLEANREWFEAYARRGGCLELHTANFTNSMIERILLPGGIRVGRAFCIPSVRIVDPTHPMITTPNRITQEELQWSCASIGELTAVPPAYRPVIVTGSGANTVGVIPRFGRGLIIVSDIPGEFPQANARFHENMLLFCPRTILLEASPENQATCRPNPSTYTLTAFGGEGSFTRPVTLTYMGSTPPEPSITVNFNPNPIPAPTPEGASSTVTVSITSTTPPGRYTLNFRGSDVPNGGRTTETASAVLDVGSQPPGVPSLQAPPDEANDVVFTPTFRWTSDQVVNSRLQIFLGPGCEGTPVREFSNIGTTSFTLPSEAALDVFTEYSWSVTASNACGTTSSECFNFITNACIAGRENVVNGGFEEDLRGWVVDAKTPAPLISTEQKHSGNKSLRLGVIAESGTPTQFGDSEVHAVVTIPSTATNPRLSFWFWPQSSDFNVMFHQQEVFVRRISPPGPSVVLMREALNNRSWINRIHGLDDFKGSLIEIHFRAHNSGDTRPIGMYLDDVSVTWGSCGPPDFFITATPPSSNEVCVGDQLTFTVRSESVNGSNFISSVMLRAENLPPGASATFARNPVPVGLATTMTLQTTSPTIGGAYSFNVVGEAVEPPPSGTRSTVTSTFITANVPDPPELFSPAQGATNVTLRPTLAWDPSFVPDGPVTFNPSSLEEMAANASALSTSDEARINAIGANSYRVQVASDPDFRTIVAQGETTVTFFSLPRNLDASRQYFWRVNATNACGTGEFSEVRNFITGACIEGWVRNRDIPIPNGLSQTTIVAAAGKIYSIGGGLGRFPDARIRQTWEYDPATDTWTRKADIPAPGPGSAFGSAVEFGGKIYVFGGFSPENTIANTLWIYNVSTNTWSRGRDLPSFNFGIAVAVVGNKIILATGSGFGNQTWEYDPAANTYRQLANAPVFASRLHGAAIGNEMHVFGFNTHIIYNAAGNTWRFGPPVPFGVLDPAVVVLEGKFYVIGGHPIAYTQIFDPATNSWSQGPPLPGPPNGLDNTSGAVVAGRIFVIGGFDGFTSVPVNFSFKFCEGSARIIPYVVDGDGSVPGVSGERTDLLIDNPTSARASAKLFFYTEDGTLDSSREVMVGANAATNVRDVIRFVRSRNEVQNVIGSLKIFATDPINVLTTIQRNSTGDLTMVEGYTGGLRSGYVPLVMLNDDFHTQVVINDPSTDIANVQLIAYSEDGRSPVATTSVSVAANGVVNFADIVREMEISPPYSGQLRWNADREVAVFARNISVMDEDGYGGMEPVRSLSEGSMTLLIPYVEDTKLFLTDLVMNNVGSGTANVTVSFVDVEDPSGGMSGSLSSRDIPVRVNSATVLSNVIRYVLHSDSREPLDKRGFLQISSSQPITALVSIVNSSTLDPDSVDAGSRPFSSSFIPVVVKAETTRTKLAISNTSLETANIQMMALNTDGSPARAPFNVRVVGNGQWFVEDLGTALGLAEGFSGRLRITGSAVLVFSQQVTDDSTGAVVPVRQR